MTIKIIKGLNDHEIVTKANKLLPHDFIDYEHVETCIHKDPFTKPDYIIACIENGDTKGLLVYAEPAALPGLKPPRQALEYLWVKLLAVDKDSEECFEKLLSLIEELAEKKGKRGVRIYGYAPWYFLTGVNSRNYRLRERLKDRGYKIVSRAVDYTVDLERYWIERQDIRIRTDDLEIREATSRNDPVFKWIEKNFSLQWSIEAQLALEKKYGRIYVAETNNGIAGFAVHSASHRYRFGPIGVDEKYRGRGLGKILLLHTLDSMRLLGIRYAIIPWTTHLFFYAWIPGVTDIREYLIYSKVL